MRVLAETSNETPECLKKLNVHTIEAFVDFIWARAGEPPRPPSEEERQTVARKKKIPPTLPVDAPAEREEDDDTMGGDLPSTPAF